MRLPVLEVKEELLRALGPEGVRRVLLKAPTGSGKSTVVPKVLLEEGGMEGMIVVVQPRRIAARMLAEYVAGLCGSRVGELVGYAVRFEKTYSERTQLVYVTDGVLQRWLAEGELEGVSCVLFDEFHERRLASDLALGRVLDLQEKRADLRVGVMSATLEVAGLEEFLEPCVLLESEGRRYPVEVSYAGAAERKRNRFGRMEEEVVWERVGRVLKEELGVLFGGQERGELLFAGKNAGFRQGAESNMLEACAPRVLVFLPGAFEIRKTVDLLERASFANGWEVCPLYSGLNPAGQRAAVRREGGPRIIVATNVAETSITIDGVRLVVDSGVARQARFDVRRGIDSLTVEKISRAAAEQRAGRAGRTGPGKCVRLWSEGEHGRRLAFELPEVARVDLAAAVGSWPAGGGAAGRGSRWLEGPEEEALGRAEKLLEDLGATGDGVVTEAGRVMAGFPLHPRMAALLLRSAGLRSDDDIESGLQSRAPDLDCVAEACFAAAVLQGEGIWDKRAGKLRERFVEEGDWSDFEADWRAVSVARENGFRVEGCKALGIQAKNAREAWQTFEQLCRMAKGRGLAVDRVRFEWNGEALARAVLAAFRDRVGVRLSEATLACRLVGKRRGKLEETSVARQGWVFVACEVTEVEGKEMVTHLRSCARVEKEWLEELFTTDGAEWDEATKKVVARKRVMFGDLVVEQEEGGELNRELAGEILAEQVLAGKAQLKNWDGSVERWIARVNFLAGTMPELEMPAIGEEDRKFVVAQVCEGAVSLKEVKNREVKPVLGEFLSEMQKASLESYAPEKMSLANGVNSRVNYKEGEEPWIEEKVQRLYGVKETPELPGGQALVVKICAPNQRPWQVTKDLEGFWQSGFGQMKKDLAGRYPKHDWGGSGG
ncbi:MAG: ATP-dependent helicase C-terminal domain-containing protein [Verrucomicrobiota bacterium]